jgi:hypothetical protein
MDLLRRKCLVAFFLCPLSAAANAEFAGNDLKQICNVYPEHTESSALCMGYIAGTLDTVGGFDKMLKLRWACEPTGVTGDQLISMTIKYLADHPDQLHNTAASLILNMYTKAFPCGEKAN